VHAHSELKLAIVHVHVNDRLSFLARHGTGYRSREFKQLLTCHYLNPYLILPVRMHASTSRSSSHGAGYTVQALAS